MSEIKMKVREFLKNNYPYSAGIADIKDTDSLMDRGILDSTAVLEVLEFLEETFQIRIEDDEVIPDNLDSLERIESFLISKGVGT